MPGSDTYGQEVSYPLLSDPPDAEVGFSGLVDALTQRSVMRFTDAAERNATLTSPEAGMVAFLTNEKIWTGYDGSAWVVLAAGTSAWTTITLASGYSHDGNDNGTVQYRLVNLFGEPTVMLRGGLGLTYPGGNIANSGVLTASPLPTAVRPSSRRTITVACSALSSVVVSLKLDAETDGHLHIIGTGPADQPPWVSLNGCFYSL